MVMKIPDSGNITGSEVVERKQMGVNPMMDTHIEPMNITPIADSLSNLGKAYKQYKEQETLSLGQQVFNDYNEHIAQFEMDWKNKHKKYDARGFYQALKDESWKFFNDRTGAPKDDGRIRISDPDQKAALQQYIEKRQPDLISRSMAYEASEYTEAQRTTIEAGLINAASRVVSSNGNAVQLADALADMDRIIAIDSRGADKERTRLLQGKQRDVAVSELVAQKATIDPVGAALMLERGHRPDGTPVGNELVYNNLNSGTEAKLRSIIKENAEPFFKAQTLAGKTPTTQDIMLAYGTNNLAEATMIRNDIITKATKEKAVSDAEFAETRATMISDMRNNVLNAKTPDEEFDAMARFADVFPNEAVQFQEMNNAIKQDQLAESLIDRYDLDGLDYIDVPVLSDKDQRLLEAMNKSDTEAIKSAVRAGGNYENVAKYKELSMQQAQQEAILYRSPVGLTPLSDGQIEIIKQYKQRSLERAQDHNRIADAFSRVVQGDVLSTEELATFEPRTARRLMVRMNDVKDYNAMAAELRIAHIDLDKIIQDTSYADFKNNPIKQGVIKGNLTRMMMDYKKTNKSYPSLEEMQQFVNRSIANAKTDADIVDDGLHKRTVAGEMQKQLLLKTTDGKTVSTSWDNKINYIKKALKKVISEADISQHKRKALRENIDIIAEAYMTGNTAGQQLLTDLLGDY